jgi:hypothetical protein
MQPENAAYPAEKLYRKPVVPADLEGHDLGRRGFAYDVQQAGPGPGRRETTSGGASP